MSDSPKRAYTDADRASSLQSPSDSLNRPDTSPELIAQLRSVGSRVRKSVTEGYKTPLNSRAFTKAQSTTTIFTSAQDINRDVFGSSDSLPSRAGPANSHKKRSRSADRESDTEPHMDTDHDMVISDIAVPAPPLSQDNTDRVIKPLRKHRGMIETRSLPAGALRFSHQPANSAGTMAPTMEAEEDWSVLPTEHPNQSPFNPAVFD